MMQIAELKGAEERSWSQRLKVLSSLWQCPVSPTHLTFTDRFQPAVHAASTPVSCAISICHDDPGLKVRRCSLFDELVAARCYA